jgi:hypothetical protein
MVVGLLVAGILAAVLGTLAVVRAAAMPAASSSKLEVTPSPNVIVAMRELSRLETESFHMERVIELTDEQTHLFGLLQAKDALLLVAVGDVTAGVDLSKLGDQDVQADWTSKRVHVRLPAPEVLSVAIDNLKTHVVTRSTDTLAERREDLEGKARGEAEATMRSGAIEGGILARARDGGEREIRAMLRSLGFTTVEVEWAAP